MIQQQLRNIGLSDREIAVYLSVQQYGKVTPSRVARDTGVNRTSVYLAAKELTEKGLISEDLGGKTLYLVAEPPKELLSLIEKEEQEVKRKRIDATEVISELLVLPRNSNYSQPKIRFVEENELKDFLYKNAKKWFQDTAKYDKIWWGFQDHTSVEQFPDWIPYTWEVAPRGASARGITNDSAIEKRLRGKHPNRHIKFWDKADAFTSTIWVTGDYIIFLVTKQHPFYLVEIHDPLIAANLRSFFKGIWKELP